MTVTEPAPAGLPTERTCPFDPPSELAELREKEPVTRMTYPDGHVGWLVTSHAAARAILADPRFSARGEVKRVPVALPRGEKPWPVVPPGWFIHLDPPEHTRYRRLLAGQFTVRRMNQLTPRIEQVTAEQLEVLAAAGSPADLVRQFALPIPSSVICELLGVPYEERELFQNNSEQVLKLDSTAEQTMLALRTIHGLMRTLVQSKRAAPATDLISGLIESSDLSDDELVGIGTLLLMAGHETTASMLAYGAYALLSHPDQLATLRARPELVDGAVEELMRYLTIAHIGIIRGAAEDVEIEGQLIKAGETVTVHVATANRDPAHFATPDRLDLTATATGHLGFGYGVHQCLGQQLARIEMRVAYAALFRRFPTLRLAVPADAVELRKDMSLYGVHRLPVAWD